MKNTLVIWVLIIAILSMGWGKNFLVKTKDATNNHKASNEKGSDYQSYDNYNYDYQEDK